MLQIQTTQFRRVHMARVITTRGAFSFEPPVEFAVMDNVTNTDAALSLLRQVFSLAYRHAMQKKPLFDSPIPVYSTVNENRVRDWFENVVLGKLITQVVFIFPEQSVAMDARQTEQVITTLQSRYGDLFRLVADILLAHALDFISWNNSNPRNEKVPGAEVEVKDRKKAIASLKLKTFFGKHYSFEVGVSALPNPQTMKDYFLHPLTQEMGKTFQRFYSAWCTAASTCDYDDKMRLTYFRQAEHVEALVSYLDDLLTGPVSEKVMGDFSIDVIGLEIPRHISNAEMHQLETHLTASFEYTNKKTAIEMISDYMKYRGTLHPSGIAH